MSSYGSLEIFFAKLSMGGRQRQRIYRKIAGLISNGVSLQAALDVLWDQASRGGTKPSDPRAIAIDIWRRSYRDGKPFGHALEGWAPLGERMLIESGESGSRLDEALRNVIRLNKNSGAIRGALIGGLAYPTFLFFFLGGVLWMFGTKVIPQFAETLPIERWTGAAASMATLSDFAKNWLIPIGAMLVMAIIIFIVTAPIWRGRLRAVMDKVPPWSLYRLVQGGGFLMSTAALVNAGVAVPEVLRKLRRNSSPWMQERIDASLREVNSGANLGDALYRSGYGFPDPEIVDDLRVYASLSSFDESLTAVANEWIERGVERVQAQARILFFIALFSLGGTIMWVVFGLFAIQRLITSAVNMQQ